MFVMTLDQRGSTGDQDRVPELIAALAQRSATNFERSVGDELQGVVASAADVVDIALFALRAGHWYVGIGLGPVQLAASSSPREGAGAGFIAARRAVEAAKAAGPYVPLSVVSGTMGQDSRNRHEIHEGVGMGELASASSNAEAVLRLLGRIVQDRTTAQWRVVDALARHGNNPYGKQKQVAQELGITEQTVSRTVHRSGWQEEQAARPAAQMLLDYAHRQSVATGSLAAGTPEAG
ncbi:hypothetical protein PSET11_02522 [Arthrobacter ulcerisalmonis]|uniref:HTH marR-type domain-containing protein n=1 Tax=Arthrobacter ulcerisalmonis TaxID=2483813 RepID=A0A3P5XR16_9MICC|nr:helix-turn-helix domain-containing protein [Arthrobacter ulcerisalmonis]VDC30406.1 hypothetical protein PSET11_02522 [Arthrobacter ulcerisalmonis]